MNENQRIRRRIISYFSVGGGLLLVFTVIKEDKADVALLHRVRLPLSGEQRSYVVAVGVMVVGRIGENQRKDQEAGGDPCASCVIRRGANPVPDSITSSVGCASCRDLIPCSCRSRTQYVEPEAGTA